MTEQAGAASTGTDCSKASAAVVLFDGACPLCRREIAFYRGLNGADAMEWIDVSLMSGEEVVPGITRTEAMRRFHVVNATGEVLAGGPAFAALWRNFPAFRPFGRLFEHKPMSWILDQAYDLFLVFRPLIQRWVGGKR